MSGAFHVDGAGGFNTSPSVNSFTAISAEAGLASKDAPTSYSATAALVNIFNQSRSGTGGKRVIIPRKLELRVNSVNTSATDFRLHFFRDDIDRWSSGGTELTGYPLSGGEDADFKHASVQARVDVGELTLASAGTLERVIWRTYAADTILAAQEMITIVWGATGEIPHAADHDFLVVHVPPMWIGPGYNLSIHEVAAAQAADPKFQFNLWWEEHDTV